MLREKLLDKEMKRQVGFQQGGRSTGIGHASKERLRHYSTERLKI
jgi:hypothetical protein